MRSEPALIGGILLDYAGIPLMLDEHFPYEDAEVSQSSKVG